MPRYQVFTPAMCPVIEAVDLAEAKEKAAKYVVLKRGWTASWLEKYDPHGHYHTYSVHNSKGRFVHGITLLDTEGSMNDDGDLSSLHVNHGHGLVTCMAYVNPLSAAPYWIATDVLGNDCAYTSKADAVTYMYTRPPAPGGDHTCSETDDQPNGDTWPISAVSMTCMLCRWEAMAIQWAKVFGGAAPSFPRPWQQRHKTLMEVFAEEAEVAEPVLSVRDLVRSKYAL